MLGGAKDAVLEEDLGDVPHDGRGPDFPEDGDRHDGPEIIDRSGPAFFQ